MSYTPKPRSEAITAQERAALVQALLALGYTSTELAVIVAGKTRGAIAIDLRAQLKERGKA